MLRGQWKDQTTAIVSRELQDSFSRNEIELSSFLLEFTCPPKKSVIHDLGGLQRNKKGLRVFNQERNSDKFIRCDNILLFYIQKYNKHFRIKISTRALIITLIRSAYCIWFKVFREYSEYSQLNWRPILILSIMVSMESYCLFYFIQLAYILLDSLQRKEFIMVQLSYLISPKKLEVIKSANSKKLLPTMQIACPLSIRAWSQLRQATLDYGQAFDRFCNFFLSCYMLIFQLLCGFLLLNYFNIIKVLTTSLTDVLMTMVELFVLFILTLDCFFTTAALNEQFDTHCKLLFQNMQTFSEISYNYTPLYTHKSFNISNQIFKTILHSFSAIIKSFDSKTTDIDEYSWYLMQMYSNLIKELRIIQICQPLKILNVAVSKNLVTQLVLSVLSILIALLWNEFIKPAIAVT